MKSTDKIRFEIGEGRLEDAFVLMENSSDLWVNPDTRDMILHLKRSYSATEHDFIKGVISRETYNSGLSEIADKIFTFLRSVDNVKGYHEFKLQSGELKEGEVWLLKVPKYIGSKNFWHKVKIFFKKSRSKRFSLYLVKTQQYWIIDCPEHIEVELLSKYVADCLFPNLKEQHFIWRLEAENIRIPNFGTVQNSGLTTYQPLNLTAEYKHHDDLWGTELKRKIVMKDFGSPTSGIGSQSNRTIK